MNLETDGPYPHERDKGITHDRIVDYAYPPGDQRRYSVIGWLLWQRYADKQYTDRGCV